MKRLYPKLKFGGVNVILINYTLRGILWVEL